MHFWNPASAPVPTAVLAAALFAAAGQAQAPAPQKPGSMIRDWNFTLQKEGRVQGRFQGALAVPAGPRSFDVEKFHVDTFSSEGEPELAGDSPVCRIHLTNDGFVVTSPGSIRLAHADGRFSVEGVGYRWDHVAGRLHISNRVETLLRIRLPELKESR